MPPAGMPRPPRGLRISKSLEESLDRAAAAIPIPAGPPSIASIAPSTATPSATSWRSTFSPASPLPVDDSGYGFDNIGDVLSFSPPCWNATCRSPAQVSRLAVGRRQHEARRRRDLSAPRCARRRRQGTQRARQRRSALRFARRLFRSATTFPVDAEYIIRVQVGQAAVAPDAAASWKSARRSPPDLRTIGVTFLRESANPKLRFRPTRAAPRRGLPGAHGRRPRRRNWTCASMASSSSAFTVPHAPSRRRSPVSPSAALTTSPAPATRPAARAFSSATRPPPQEEEPCARTILASVGTPRLPPSGHRRRPQAAARLLPQRPRRRRFRFRHREGAPRHSGLARFPVPHRAGSAQRRTRLRLPHQRSRAGLAPLLLPLEQHSRRHACSTSPRRTSFEIPAILAAQVRRMLDDPRVRFAGLQLRRPVALHSQPPQQKPDPDAFPEFDESLRNSFQHETELFFQNILREDRSRCWNCWTPTTPS